MVAKMIDNMTLDELTETYLCKKYGKDPIKCLDCEKHNSCPAGKRAIVLLNEMTESPKKLTKTEEACTIHQKRAREQAEIILKNDDPLKYLIEVEGLKVHTAKERIRLYKLRYPDLFTADELKPKKRTIKDDPIKRMEYLEAVTSGDPLNYYKNKYGLKYDTAYHRWKYYEEKYKNNAEDKKDMVKVSDNEEEVSLNDFLSQRCGIEKYKNNAENKKDMVKVGENEEDISLDDFLSQHCGIENPKETEMRIDEKLGASIYSVKNTYESLIREKEALEAKLKWYDDTIKSFEIVMNVMKGR